MEKFSIDDDHDTEVQGFNPICIKPLPKYVMPKGSVVEQLSRVTFRGVLRKERKGISGFFFSSPVNYERYFYFEDEFLYALDKESDIFIVQESWHLRRIFKIEIKKENHQNLCLILINKSHNPTDDIKQKHLQVFNHKDFMETLRRHLEQCEIDLY
jgi:hypothetical protein